MMKKLFLVMLIVSMSCTVSFSQRQEVPKTMIIKMLGGEEYTGEIVSQDNEYLILKSKNGELKLLKTKIQSMQESTYKGQFEFENPNMTRYLFGPSAIPLKKGKGYYQNVLVTFNFVNVGITDNISIGGGFEFVSALAGEPIWFLTPKLSHSINEKNHVGVGVLTAGLSTRGSGTIMYGVYTRGTGEANVTVGAGYGLFDGDVSSTPVLTFSAFKRLTNGLALTSENYIGTSGNGNYFGIQGVRLMSRRNSFDIGGMVIPGLDLAIPVIPYASYVRSF
jgi:hypothetical protein